MTHLLDTATSRLGRAAGPAPAARPPYAQSIQSGHAQTLLTDLGFLLVPGPPLDRGAAYLLVALRPRPSETHFDPERIEYWATDQGRADLTRLEWPMSPCHTEYAWGVIRIVDRIAAANGFVSFGGTLTVSRDRDLHAALFRSHAPILALGGHSGPADPLAANIAGFFARLLAAAIPGTRLAREAAATSPVALYAAFVWGALGSYHGVTAADIVSPRLLSLLRSERRRLQAESSADEYVGRMLAAELSAVGDRSGTR
jgi:hypothetical protein